MSHYNLMDLTWGIILLRGINIKATRHSLIVIEMIISWLRCCQQLKKGFISRLPPVLPPLVSIMWRSLLTYCRSTVTCVSGLISLCFLTLLVCLSPCCGPQQHQAVLEKVSTHMPVCPFFFFFFLSMSHCTGGGPQLVCGGGLWGVLCVWDAHTDVLLAGCTHDAFQENETKAVLKMKNPY